MEIVQQEAKGGGEKIVNLNWNKTATRGTGKRRQKTGRRHQRAFSLRERGVLRFPGETRGEIDNNESKDGIEGGEKIT